MLSYVTDYLNLYSQLQLKQRARKDWIGQDDLHRREYIPLPGPPAENDPPPPNSICIM